MRVLTYAESMASWITWTSETMLCTATWKRTHVCPLLCASPSLPTRRGLTPDNLPTYPADLAVRQASSSRGSAAASPARLLVECASWLSDGCAPDFGGLANHLQPHTIVTLPHRQCSVRTQTDGLFGGRGTHFAADRPFQAYYCVSALVCALCSSRHWHSCPCAAGRWVLDSIQATLNLLLA